MRRQLLLLDVFEDVRAVLFQHLTGAVGVLWRNRQLHATERHPEVPALADLVLVEDEGLDAVAVEQRLRDVGLVEVEVGAQDREAGLALRQHRAFASAIRSAGSCRVSEISMNASRRYPRGEYRSDGPAPLIRPAPRDEAAGPMPSRRRGGRRKGLTSDSHPSDSAGAELLRRGGPDDEFPPPDPGSRSLRRTGAHGSELSHPSLLPTRSRQR